MISLLNKKEKDVLLLAKQKLVKEYQLIIGLVGVLILIPFLLLRIDPVFDDHATTSIINLVLKIIILVWHLIAMPLFGVIIVPYALNPNSNLIESLMSIHWRKMLLVIAVITLIGLTIVITGATIIKNISPQSLSSMQENAVSAISAKDVVYLLPCIASNLTFGLMAAGRFGTEAIYVMKNNMKSLGKILVVSAFLFTASYFIDKDTVRHLVECINIFIMAVIAAYDAGMRPRKEEKKAKALNPLLSA